ncbi:hypothetical protein GJ496_009160 [Pomphorhynchus laevis]|nr:hypothetical protein GJ496_009160 [Pomphorhynchus laevis]
MSLANLFHVVIVMCLFFSASFGLPNVYCDGQSSINSDLFTMALIAIGSISFISGIVIGIVEICIEYRWYKTKKNTKPMPITVETVKFDELLGKDNVVKADTTNTETV